MAREPAARSGDIALELRKECDACALVNPELANRLTSIADVVEQIHKSINRFAAIEGMADFLALHKDFPFCWSARFNRLLGAFWMDALQGSDTKRKDALRRALRFLRDVYVAVYLLSKVSPGSVESWITQIKENPLLCDTNFHEFLDERAHFAALNGHTFAEAFAQMASYIRHCCTTVSAITQLRQMTPSEEYVSVRLPLPPDLAELWFIVNEEFSTAMTEIAEEVNRGTQTLAAGIQAALRVGPKVEDESKSTDTFYAAAFLEHLLRVANDDISRQAIDCYRSLADTGQWSSAESRATYILRYSKALLNYWRLLGDPLTRLEHATGLIGDALSL